MSEIVCKHCGRRYITKGLKGQEIVTASDGSPAIACPDCHWQIPLIETVDAKRVQNQIKAHEKYLKGE